MKLIARATSLVAAILLLSDASAGKGGQAPKAAGASPDRLPVLAAGGRLKTEDGKKKELTRTVRLPTRGVWYLWVRATAKSGANSVIAYSLDGTGYKSRRGRFTVQPSARSQWISHSDYPEFNCEVHADRPGSHELKLAAEYGEVEIEKIALTLFFSAKPKGDTLDHSGDPGGGAAVFPDSPVREDGFRPDWSSPSVKADRSYHVDARDGDDSADGLTPATAWKTFRNVNGRAFKPSEAVLLKRGSRWEEGLAPAGSGTATRWITLGAYGEGRRPVINGVNRDAVLLSEQSYWVVQDLEVTSDPEYKRCGLKVTTAAGKPQPKGIKVFNVIAYDNGPAGIVVGSDHGGGNGYDGVEIENCLSYAQDSDGILVCGSDQNGCRNSVIRYSTAYSNLYGGGIWIQSGQNGLIEHCLAYNNACINIWTWNSINVTIRHCEAFRGRTPRDAGGFDIDWGCEACTLEYCYSHHNEGVGILLMGGGDGTYRDFPVHSFYNLARFNVSMNDSPGIGLVETFEDSKVHNNLVVTSGSKRSAIDISGWPTNPWDDVTKAGGWPARTEFVNNIFVGRAGALPSYVDDWAATREYGNVFDRNLYWRDTPGPLVRWGGRRNGSGFWTGKKSADLAAPKDYRVMKDFSAATGQETGGMSADPGFSAPYRGEYGRLPLEPCRLKPDSPALGKGNKVALSKEWLAGRAKFLTETGAAEYGIPMEPAPATEDFWGSPLDPGAYPIGPCAR